MYMLDPETGRRRRARVRDKAVATGHDAQRLARDASRHTADHLRGTAAEIQGQMRDTQLSGRQLHERIRAELGRLVDRPGNVDVSVSNGDVKLSGSAKPSEIPSVVAAVSAMQGVERVENRLTTAPVPAGGQGAQTSPGGRTH